MTQHSIQIASDSLALNRLEYAERAVAESLRSDDDVESTPAPNLASLLLVVSAQSSTLDDGRWQFAIETAAGEPILEAQDCERGDLNRLTLLAAVRGLEAIDGPSGVTLLSHNRYLIRSLTDSLPRWRRSDFVWDHFGRRVEVQHADLWRRIDHALSIHEVQACLLTARMVSRPAAVAPKNSLTVPATPNPTGHVAPTRIDSPHEEPSFSHNGNRLRDWLLQSAVDTSHRAHRIAMMGPAGS
ncbi:ribonuclease H family protein [Allorhodopirellula solitaria]|uniref:Ribonuclease HI n=1 Tax=Allorhodopirellula solitaria TaxID=2527987 RepID=A0A5C5YJY2_9BACT|nr:ribonuclease HI [Allorhodopirellula solitaria]TWT75213.1 Ribonuclease HI [Allorhodopirellula solitaria]